MLYSAYVGEAQKLASELASEQAHDEHQVEAELESLKFFSVPESSIC